MRRKFQRVARLIRMLILVLASCLTTLLVVRALTSLRGEPLQVWHTHVPDEPSIKELGLASWQDYLAAENRIFDELKSAVAEKIPDNLRGSINRFDPESPLYPGNFATDWNRSYVLQPEGKPVGAVVLLHGLTDSPYSLRHIAATYQKRGFVAVGIRLPGHGTVPGGLTKVDWQTWSAAVEVAVREGIRLAGTGSPLHLVGYSNGGALALKFALDAIDRPDLQMPEQLVLVSPMIGITELARFAGVAGWPAVFPAFARSSWISILPEFNPYKYNSFPVNAARQSSLLVRSLQPRIARFARAERLENFPPVLAFQSAMDSTTSARAVVEALFDHLPANGSELVLFDLNRSLSFGPLVRPDAEMILARILPPAPRDYTVSVITNSDVRSRGVCEQKTAAGTEDERVRNLDLEFPKGVFALSHVAVPFPVSDSLYGLFPDPSGESGIGLGSISPRGERGTLVMSMDELVRMMCNPFFPYLIERVEEKIGPSNLLP